MKRLLLALLILLIFCIAFSITAFAAEESPEAIETEEETDAEVPLETYIIALIPSVGTLIGSAVVFWRIIKQFSGLRKDVLDEAAIAQIKKETKSLQQLVQKLIEQQETELQDTESLKRSVECMQMTAQKLELHLCRIESSMNEPEKDVMGHL